MSDADTSSAARKGGSRATWAMVVVAVPVLYLLGIPPLLYYLGRNLPGTQPLAPYPLWAARVAEPWMWLQRTNLLHEPLTQYEYWWMNQTPLIIR